MGPGGKAHPWTAMRILFIISFPFVCRTQGTLKIIDTPSPVRALLGQKVTIPCVLTDGDYPERDLDLDLVTDSVRWEIKVNGSNRIIYTLIDGQHKPRRPNSNVELEEFKRGNASLTLHDVQKSDEGEYTCNMFVAGNKIWAARTVEVSAMPEVTLSSYQVILEPGNEQSVTCYVNNFFPESVKIWWEKHSALSMESASERLDRGCTNVPTQGDDGTFNVTSLLSVKPSSNNEDGDEYLCIVSHRSLVTEHTERFVLTVKEPPASNHLPAILAPILSVVGTLCALFLFLYFRKSPPKISDIAGLDNLVHGKKSILTWMVSGFNPNIIEITVFLVRGEEKKDINSWRYPSPKANTDAGEVRAENGEALQPLNKKTAAEPLAQPPSRTYFTYNCLCSTEIQPDKKKHKGAKLVIEVKHISQKSNIYKRETLNIKGDIFTAHILAPQYLKHGKQATLTCEITKCDPEPLLISWRNEKHDICINGAVQDTRYTYTENLDEEQKDNVLKTSSFLTFMVEVKKDHGMKYICIVQYSTIKKNLVKQLETLITAEPVVEQISCKNVGQEMELSCHIHSFHPGTIEIKWFKGEEALPTTDCELRAGEDGLYSTTSILQYIPEIEDIGKIFKCQVDHQSLEFPETREWKLEEQ